MKKKKKTPTWSPSLSCSASHGDEFSNWRYDVENFFFVRRWSNVHVLMLMLAGIVVYILLNHVGFYWK